MTDSRLDKVGEFVMTRLRDRGIDFADGVLAGALRAPALADVQAAIGRLSLEDRTLLRAVVVESIDVAVHDFLFALGEASDFDTGVELRCAGVNVAEISDGLQGELFGADGWVARFSKYAPAASSL